MNKLKTLFFNLYEKIISIIENKPYDVIVKFINTSNNPLPQYATAHSSGFDLAYSGETIILKGNSGGLFKTGLYCEIPNGYEMQIRPRSGLALSNWITIVNSPGTIDSDYRGEIGVLLYNLSGIDLIVTPGMRIAQGVIKKQERARIKLVKSLSSTCRGEGGFGHTGK